jgi:hypothetical protein
MQGKLQEFNFTSGNELSNAYYKKESGRVWSTLIPFSTVEGNTEQAKAIH